MYQIKLLAIWAECVGYNNSATIKNSYNNGEILCTSSSQVGALTGANARGALVENCYNIANVTGKTYVGSIIGRNTAITPTCNVKNTYYLKNTGVGYSKNLGGECTTIEKEEKEMKESALLLGNAFTDDIQNEDGTWKYNDGYPILKWQLEEN